MLSNKVSLESNFYIRQGTKSDVSQLAELMNAQYARKRNKSYFLWQFFNSYNPAILMCAFSGKKLIGMVGVKKRKLNIRATAGQLVDILVAPEYRGVGIFTALGNAAIKYFPDMDLLFVLPNINGKNACERTFGFKTLAKIDSVEIAPNKVKKIDKKLLADLQKEPTGDNLIKLATDNNYRKWRLEKHPEFKYTKISIKSECFTISKIFTDPVSKKRFGDIVDYECNRSKQDLYELFLKSTLYFKNKHVESVTTWALEHEVLYKIISAIGFKKVPRERYFCVKVLNNKYKHLYDIANWHLVQADAELY